MTPARVPIQLWVHSECILSAWEQKIGSPIVSLISGVRILAEELREEFRNISLMHRRTFGSKLNYLNAFAGILFPSVSVASEPQVLNRANKGWEKIGPFHREGRSIILSSDWPHIFASHTAYRSICFSNTHDVDSRRLSSNSFRLSTFTRSTMKQNILFMLRIHSLNRLLREKRTEFYLLSTRIPLLLVCIVRSKSSQDKMYDRYTCTPVTGCNSRTLCVMWGDSFLGNRYSASYMSTWSSHRPGHNVLAKNPCMLLFVCLTAINSLLPF